MAKSYDSVKARADYRRLSSALPSSSLSKSVASCFPVAAIEILNLPRYSMAWIEAAEIHAPRAGMRARAVEWLDPAAIAE